MKKLIIICLALIGTLTFNSCEKDKDTTPDPNNPGTTVDPTTYDQYITCKVDGTTYTAYYAAGHTTNVNCVFNSSVQTVFETSADEIEVTGADNLLSDLSITLIGFQAKGVGTYTGGDDLYLDGVIERMVGGSKQRIAYVVSHNETLVVESYTGGYIKGTFSVEVQDENNPGTLYQVTEGKFRMKVQ
jgi:hypothetical protein